jgi:hypothetical protein
MYTTLSLNNKKFRFSPLTESDFVFVLPFVVRILLQISLKTPQSEALRATAGYNRFSAIEIYVWFFPCFTVRFPQ